MKPWNAAVYIRTSKGAEEDLGNTLGVQLGIIMAYLDKEEDIELKYLPYKIFHNLLDEH